MSDESEDKWMLQYILWVPGDNSTKSLDYVDNLTSLEECIEKKKTIRINRRRGYCILHASAHGPNGEVVVL